MIREKDIWLAISDDSQASSMKRRLPRWPGLEALSMWVERILIGNRDIDSYGVPIACVLFHAVTRHYQ